jgi:hypothetical protein
MQMAASCATAAALVSKLNHQKYKLESKMVSKLLRAIKSNLNPKP